MIWCETYEEAKLRAIYLISNCNNVITKVQIGFDNSRNACCPWFVDYEENEDFREFA